MTRVGTNVPVALALRIAGVYGCPPCRTAIGGPVAVEWRESVSRPPRLVVATLSPQACTFRHPCAGSAVLLPLPSRSKFRGRGHQISAFTRNHTVPAGALNAWHLFASDEPVIRPSATTHPTSLNHNKHRSTRQRFRTPPMDAMTVGSGGGSNWPATSHLPANKPRHACASAQNPGRQQPPRPHARTPTPDDEEQGDTPQPPKAQATLQRHMPPPHAIPAPPSPPPTAERRRLLPLRPAPNSSYRIDSALLPPLQCMSPDDVGRLARSAHNGGAWFAIRGATSEQIHACQWLFPHDDHDDGSARGAIRAEYNPVTRNLPVKCMASPTPPRRCTMSALVPPLMGAIDGTALVYTRTSPHDFATSQQFPKPDATFPGITRVREIPVLKDSTLVVDGVVTFELALADILQGTGAGEGCKGIEFDLSASATAIVQEASILEWHWAVSRTQHTLEADKALLAKASSAAVTNIPTSATLVL
ncbi:hypothetical protein DFH27DRAFT_604379 [Peziza echinospora]|nr:hypothetical protein DFH27DRAFT_604379 [Peziza echinospora]